MELRKEEKTMTEINDIKEPTVVELKNVNGLAVKDLTNEDNKEKTVMTDNTIRNHEHYADPTPYEAFKNIDKQKYGNNVRFYKLLHMIFALCDLCGFEFIGRITLKDKKTGKIYK